MLPRINLINILPIVLIALLLHPLTSRTSFSPTHTATTAERVLLVTAHPDDEAFFFAPTLLALLSQQLEPKPEVHSICLSTGNADGLGEIRVKELHKSLDMLGIEKGRRVIIDSPDLPDNITLPWGAHTIADAIRPYIVQNRITTILTFDDQGISSHPNHASLPTGLLHLLHTLPSFPTGRIPLPPVKPRLWSLITVPTPTKYTGFLSAVMAKLDLGLDLIIHHYFSPPSSSVQSAEGKAEKGSPAIEGENGMPVFVSGAGEYWTAVRAIYAHESQLVWFRWLYLLFSRYMWVNEWVELRPEA